MHVNEMSLASVTQRVTQGVPGVAARTEHATKVFGTLAGLVAGLSVGWGVAVVIAKSGASQFAVPLMQLVIIVAIAGVLAAMRPASRTAGLDVLEAVAYE